MIAGTTRTFPELPPVPDDVHERSLLAFHPGDRAFFLLSRRQLWRVTHDGAGTRVTDVEPADNGSDIRELLYYSAERQALMHVTQPEYAAPLAVARFDGTEFVPLALAGGAPAGRGDGIVFDAKRSVLVHLCGPRDGASGTLTVHELAGDAKWRTTTTAVPCGENGVVAGFDARSARVVVISVDSGEAHAWNGQQFEALDDFPRPMSQWPVVTTTAPRTGNLVLIQFAPFESPGGEVRDGVAVWELDGRTWTSRDAGKLEVFGGAAHDPGADVTVIAGVWFGAGTPQYSLGHYDGARIVPAGLPCIEIEGGSTGGPPRYWGRRAASHESSSREVNRLYTAQVLYDYRDGALIARCATPPAAKVLSGAAGSFVLTEDGAVFQLGDKGWIQRGSPSPGYRPRTGATCGVDGSGTVFVLGGESIYNREFVADGFLIGSATTALPAKGQPAIASATAVHDPLRDAWIVLGGSNRKGKEDGRVHELVAGKWTAYETSITGKRVLPGLAAWDEASQQVFLFAVLLDAKYNSEQRLFVYRGEGQWHDAGALEADGGHAAWDPSRRTIVLASAERTCELAIGVALDAARPAGASAPMTAEKPADRKKVAKAKPPEPAPTMTAHLIQFGGRGKDQFGGLPIGVTKARWPMCRSCGSAMQHLLTLHAHRSRLPLRDHAALAAFICNSGKPCATWEPDAGCNAVLRLTAAQLEVKAATKAPPGAGGEAPSPVVGAEKIRYETRSEEDPHSDEGAPLEAASKVGGYPVWQQGEAVPVCSKCEQPMRFIAQLLEETGELNFGGGDAYVFCCADEHEAKLLWQQ